MQKRVKNCPQSDEVARRTGSETNASHCRTHGSAISARSATSILLTHSITKLTANLPELALLLRILLWC